MSRTVISVNPKSILTKEKTYCPDVGRMEERYFIYRIVWDDKGRVYHIPISKEGYPECSRYGIKSLRKAKKIHLLESI